MANKEMKVEVIPMPQHTNRYAYTIWAKKGIGGKVFLGTLKDKSRLEIDALCKALELQYKDTYPRGMDYEMMEYIPEMEQRF